MLLRLSVLLVIRVGVGLVRRLLIIMLVRFRILRTVFILRVRDVRLWKVFLMCRLFTLGLVVLILGKALGRRWLIGPLVG